MIASMSGSQALWYLTRGTGLVALLLLTASIALGVAEVTRWANPRIPRFVIAALHKNISLLVVVFLAIHIVTAIADSFAPVGWLDVIVPFRSPYRPLWLGLGAVAFDLLVALIVTSLLRNRLGYRVWRAVHWTAYACWPIALLHGLGTGSDVRVRWSLTLSIVCLVFVAVAVALRLASARGVPGARRAWAGAGSALLVWLVLAWTFTGPDAPGWARKAGTPASLLGGHAAASSATTAWRVPFDARVTGTIRRVATARDRVDISVGAILSGGARGSVHLTIDGAPLGSGGVKMDHGVATLGPVAQPQRYRGSVVAFDATSVRARVHDVAGHTLLLAIRLNIDQAHGTLTGTASVRASA